MGNAWVRLGFDMSWVWGNAGIIASTCCSRLMHTQMPAKAGEVSEGFPTLSTVIEGLWVSLRGTRLH